MYQYFNENEYIQRTQSVSWVASFEKEYVLFDENSKEDDDKNEVNTSSILEKIDLLKPFMLEEDELVQYSLRQKSLLLIPKPSVVAPPSPPETLFWCIYSGVFGLNDYSTILKKSNREIEEKHKIIEFIQKNPGKIKKSNHKTTKVMMQEIMSDLLSNREISMQSLIVLAVFYNVNIYLVKKNVYYIFKQEIEEEYLSTEISSKKNIFIFHKNKNSYIFQEDCENNAIENIEQNCFLIENIKKPLKAASFYKNDSLERIALKFNINTSEYKTKKELYDVLFVKISMEE